MKDDAELREIAALCSRIVYNWAGPSGFDDDKLCARLPRLSALTPPERFRVFVLLAQSPYIATAGSGSRWQFWARHHAPKHAYTGSEIRQLT
ncbi:MAG: hypothetical protein KGI71_06490 [Patescibacteria group bacterium]|nr:hypothetical protein [Patescibacteria group bacterium]